MSKPGKQWRILAHDLDPAQPTTVDVQGDGKTVFDELVIDKFFHLEQMDDSFWWMRVGEATFHILVDAQGKAAVRLVEGELADKDDSWREDR